MVNSGFSDVLNIIIYLKQLKSEPKKGKQFKCLIYAHWGLILRKQYKVIW